MFVTNMFVIPSSHEDEREAHTSRRQRPAKPALTRQGIVDAAVSIMRAEGLAKVTMRRIAAVLDTGPASLYVYVRDTGISTRRSSTPCSARRPGRPPEGTWQDRLKALLTSYQEVLFTMRRSRGWR